MSWNGVAKGGEFVGACTSAWLSGLFIKASVVSEDAPIWARALGISIGVVTGVASAVLLEDVANGDELML